MNMRLGKAYVFSSKGLWRFPRLELGGEVVVEGQQPRGMSETRGLGSSAIPRAASDPWAPGARGPSPTGRRDNP